jgi:hypothetical protein
MRIIFFLGNLKVSRPVGNIGMDRQEMEYEGVVWIPLVQDNTVSRKHAIFRPMCRHIFKNMFRRVSFRYRFD